MVHAVAHSEYWAAQLEPANAPCRREVCTSREPSRERWAGAARWWERAGPNPKSKGSASAKNAATRESRRTRTGTPTDGMIADERTRLHQGWTGSRVSCVRKVWASKRRAKSGPAGVATTKSRGRPLHFAWEPHLGPVVARWVSPRLGRLKSEGRASAKTLRDGRLEDECDSTR